MINYELLQKIKSVQLLSILEKVMNLEKERNLELLIIDGNVFTETMEKHVNRITAIEEEILILSLSAKSVICDWSISENLREKKRD